MRLIDKDNNVEKLNARRENFSTSHAPGGAISSSNRVEYMGG